MRKPRGKKANQNERRRVQKDEERRMERQRSEEPGVCPPSRPPSPFPDLCYVDATPGAVEGAGAANDVSGEQLMGDRPADAASPPPGELCRIAIVTRDPLSFLLVFFLTLTRALALLILSELSRVRANRRVRVALIPCPRFPPALLRAH